MRTGIGEQFKHLGTAVWHVVCNPFVGQGELPEGREGFSAAGKIGANRKRI
jgi:hypothetical protein